MAWMRHWSGIQRDLQDGQGYAPVYAPCGTYRALFEWPRWWSQHQLRVSAVCSKIHCGPEIEQSEKAKHSLYRVCDSGPLPELNMAAAFLLHAAFIRKTSWNCTRLSTIQYPSWHICVVREGNELGILVYTWMMDLSWLLILQCWCLLNPLRTVERVYKYTHPWYNCRLLGSSTKMGLLQVIRSDPFSFFFFFTFNVS